MPRTESLLKRTKQLLKKDKRKLPEIASAAGVGYFWLRAFKSGTLANPGIIHVEKLHEALSRNA